MRRATPRMAATARRLALLERSARSRAANSPTPVPAPCLIRLAHHLCEALPGPLHSWGRAFCNLGQGGWDLGVVFPRGSPRSTGLTEGGIWWSETECRHRFLPETELLSSGL
ncbi:hypothetical protein TREES_T100008410 [Tupaia chinensis]|uniref:Uncharacterized protein n=1 Tax=Tupaia chinensis TaxID=246437 RepID=L9LDN9_TUPCH|nr:hypothetical protein TREES_T100008410 [Tupaia chinensis]